MAHRVSLIAKAASTTTHRITIPQKDQYIILYMHTTELTYSYIHHVSAQ
jgi:hypothetical protein